MSEVGDEEADTAKSFIMELFATGKVTLKLFKLIEPMLKSLSLSKIQLFKSQMESQGVNIPDSVKKAFAVILDAKLVEMIKNRKLHAIFLYQKLQEKKEAG